MTAQSFKQRSMTTLFQEATATQGGYVSTGTQTFAGIKTFTEGVVAGVAHGASISSVTLGTSIAANATSDGKYIAQKTAARTFLATASASPGTSWKAQVATGGNAGDAITWLDGMTINSSAVCSFPQVPVFTSGLGAVSGTTGAFSGRITGGNDGNFHEFSSSSASGAVQFKNPGASAASYVGWSNGTSLKGQIGFTNAGTLEVYGGSAGGDLVGNCVGGAWTLGAANTTRHTLQGATTAYEPTVKINNSSNTATASGLVIHSGSAGGTGASLYVGTYNDGAQLLHITPTTTAIRLSNVSTASAVYYNTQTQDLTYSSSSARFKDNIRDSNYGLASVLALQSRMFEYKYDGRTDIGLIAEEVYPVVPELIGLDKDGVIEAVDYSKFVSVLIKAVQELNDKVEAKDTIINDLLTRLTTLEARVI